MAFLFAQSDAAARSGTQRRGERDCRVELVHSDPVERISQMTYLTLIPTSASIAKQKSGALAGGGGDCAQLGNAELAREEELRAIVAERGGRCCGESNAEEADGLLLSSKRHRSTRQAQERWKERLQKQSVNSKRLKN